jgi:hypothetical protein
MIARAIPLFILTLAAFVSACSGPHTAGYGPVRIETYPLDGACSLKGNGYSMKVKAPANLVVPLSAAPVTLTCSTESGYKGTEFLGSNYVPWSSSNASSLGLGFLVDQISGSGRGFPELVRVTMIFTEAGKPEDLRDIKPQTTGIEIPSRGPEIAAKNEPAMTKEIPKLSGDLPMPPKPKTENTSMPVPPAKTSTAEKMDDKAVSKDLSVPDKESKKAALPMSGMMAKVEPTKIVAKKNIRVHLSSFKERKNADRSWRTLRRTHSNLLQKYSSSMETVKVNKKGTFLRVYAGPLTSEKAAHDLCDALKRKNIYCRPVAAGAN